MGWTEFALVLALFVATHFLPSWRPVRNGLIGAVGRRAYFAGYGAVSTVLLVWLVVAAGRAPYLPVLDPAGWQRWVPNLVMPVAVLLLTMGVGLRYPYTLGGRGDAAFDPDRPGLAALTRHPVAWALALWAAAHLLANPDLAHVVLFGGFAAISLAAMRLFDARARAAEPARWPALRAATAILSLRPLADPAWLRRNAGALALRVAAALFVYVGLYHLHGPVIGASPAP